MMNALYNQKLLALAGNIPSIGRLDKPDGQARVVSKLCGSTVDVALQVEAGRVSAFAHEVRACALGQASSSIMARNIVGASPERLFRLYDEVEAMLKRGADAPEDGWNEVGYLEPVRDFPARHDSTLLTFRAVARALQDAGYQAPCGRVY